MNLQDWIILVFTVAIIPMGVFWFQWARRMETGFTEIRTTFQIMLQNHEVRIASLERIRDADKGD